MTQALIIARREIGVRLASKATILSMVIVVLLALLIGGGFRVAADQHWLGDKTSVALTPETQPYASTLTHLDGPGMPTFTVLRVNSVNQARERVANGDVDYAFVEGAKPDTYRLITASPVTMTEKAIFTQLAASNALTTYVQQLGGAASELNAIVRDSQVSIQSIEANGHGDLDLRAAMPAAVMIFFIFFALTIGANILGQSVIEEKSSRVIEVLLATVRPLQLMVGKVLGVGVVVLVQTAVYIAAAWVGLVLSGFSRLISLDLTGTLALTALFAIIGYFGYAFLYAGLASTVSHVEDSGQALAPGTFLLLVAFYVPFFGLMIPGATILLKVGTYIPFVSCFTAAPAYALGVVSLPAVFIGLAIQVVATVLVAWLAAVVYRRAILNFGTRRSVVATLRGA